MLNARECFTGVLYLYRHVMASFQNLREKALLHSAEAQQNCFGLGTLK